MGEVGQWLDGNLRAVRGNACVRTRAALLSAAMTTLVAARDVPLHPFILTVSQDRAAIFLLESGADASRLLALDAADLATTAELPIHPLLERLACRCPSFAIEASGRSFAVAAGPRLTTIGFRDHPGELLHHRDIPTRTWIHSVVWAADRWAFIELDHAVHFDPDRAPWPLRGVSRIVAGPATLAAYGRAYTAAYDLAAGRQRYLLERPVYPIAVLPDGRVAVLPVKSNTNPAVLEVLDHDGSTAARLTIPSRAYAPCVASPGGVLALHCNTGLVLLRVADARCVLLPDRGVLLRIAWIGDDRLLLVRQTPDAAHHRIEVHDITAALETWPAYTGDPPRRPRRTAAPSPHVV